MRIRLLLLLMMLFCLQGIGQQSLSGSRRTSVHTYIYKINTRETLALFTSALQKVGEKYLHTLIDSFTTGSHPPVLADGNYLFVHVEENTLHYSLQTVGDMQYKLVGNDRDLIVTLHDRLGQSITSAQVLADNRKMRFDEDANAFRLNKTSKAKLIKIYRADVLYIFPVSDVASRYGYRNRSFGYNIAHSFPLKYLVNPVQRWFNKRTYRRRPDFFYGPVAYEGKYRGFMAFNKPRYKPNDTVRLKAFIMNKNGSPVNRPLLLRLSNRNLDIDTILAVITPYRKGGFDYSFVVNDSLDLDLDEGYLLTLEEKSSRKYDLNEYDGDLDDNEYAARRKVLMRRKFEYEEYELTSTRFMARADKESHQRGNPVAVYLSAKDENDLPVTDGRVEINVIPESGSSLQFYQPDAFLQDTLWHYSQAIESAGETKVMIPDSIFPDASFSYMISCVFLNSNNERKTQTLYQSFNGLPYKIYFTTRADSLLIGELRNADTIRTTALLYTLGGNEDTLQRQAIDLPAAIPISPFAEHYKVVTPNGKAEYDTRTNGREVSCMYSRTQDSVFIRLINPNKLACWITLFEGNKVIHRYYGDSLSFSDKAKSKGNYFVSIRYIYGNMVYKEEYTIPFRDKLLSVQVKQPKVVYPGQTIPIDIAVTDVDGKPVADADVTALSYTAKFANDKTPAVPYLGKVYKNRRRYGAFYSEEKDTLKGSGVLNWQKWSREAGLDSIEYFKFLHPSELYIHTEPVADSATQIAPFAVIKGELQFIYQIYIDEVPVYFNQAQQQQPYSFRVKEGRHSVRLRTRSQMITIDSIWAAKGVKTFVCINADTSNKQLRFQKMPEALTVYEKNLWSRYMLLLQNNFGEALTVAAQEDRLFLLNPEMQSARFNYYAPVLVGPFTGAAVNLSVRNKFHQVFEPEGNSIFTITPGLIKIKQPPYGQYAFGSALLPKRPMYNLKDLAFTGPVIDSLWRDYLDHRNATEDLFQNKYLDRNGNGRLLVNIVQGSLEGRDPVKNILFFRYDDPDYLHIYKGITRNLGFTEPGLYRIMVLLRNDNYIVRDSLLVRPDGVNYFTISNVVKPKDEISLQIVALINNRERRLYGSWQDGDLGNIKETFNEKYLDVSTFTNRVYGQVKDEKDAPLYGVTVMVKGTKTGTVTDLQGYFSLLTPGKGTLVFASVGYEGIEKRINGITEFNIKLQTSESALQEVVVVGYGTSKKRDITGAIAGVTPGILIRGLSSVSASEAPLIIIDGMPFNGNLSDLDPSLMQSTSILKDAAATSIWGARAGNGVIVITTTANSNKPKAINPQQAEALPAQGNTLRRNFRDDAFWQPRLNTNAQGKASFNVTFPDDITNWRTIVMAVGNHKQTGMAEGTISAYKVVSANLALPQFMIAGDNMNVIGKALNYRPDSVQLERRFYVEDKLAQERSIIVKNSYIDTFGVTAAGRDSLKLKYTIQKADGYFDGEERSIPVYQQGVQETNGFFAVLAKDTSFVWQPGNNGTPIKIHAETTVLPVLLDEIDKLRDYEYLCNEQLASKLKALLLKKKVYASMGKTFREEKNIRELISKLNQNKANGNLWGWWVEDKPAPWISLHVAEALLMADTAGYTVTLNKQMVTDFLLFNIENYSTTERISALRLIRLLNSKIEIGKYIDSLERQRATLTLYETLKLQELKQLSGMKVMLDTLIAKQKNTVFGNCYWGEDNYRFFDNSIQNTVTMYRLLKAAGGHNDLLQKIQYYFLEKRKSGQWRNTYESSLILETILPDLLPDQAALKPASLVINDSAAIQSFPYTTAINKGTTITIKKEGAQPVYFTAYTQYWNATPQKAGDNFNVTALFEKNNDPVTTLKAGEPVTLKVNVSVKADADFVMVEIPIPAGCSYKDKFQPHTNNEVHREYFKNKVSLFCSSLAKGDYTFTVSLLPRYTGAYHLNPAKAEMMYFPVFFGREAMKQVQVN
ncbi:MAG: carboxypeptidase-like regulatory domain-containing protein [Chitinophagaceae bacterium]